MLFTAAVLVSVILLDGRHQYRSRAYDEALRRIESRVAALEGDTMVDARMGHDDDIKSLKPLNVQSGSPRVEMVSEQSKGTADSAKVLQVVNAPMESKARRVFIDLGANCG